MIKIATWNVNSINTRLPRLLRFLLRERPDVLCLQELKCQEEKFPVAAITDAGYQAAVFGQKTYNGVALLSKEPLRDIQKGFQDGVEDPAARFICGRYRDIWVASAYVPNGQSVGSEAYQYKLRWYERLSHLVGLRVASGGSMVVGGDFNVAPEDKDVHSPEEWRGQILFSDPERAALQKLFQTGLADTFRHLHPEGGSYSWWDYRSLAFPFNKGLRIDLVLASADLIKRCTAARIDREERKGEKPSDHAPCLAEFAPA